MPISIPIPCQHLSFSKSLQSSPTPLFLQSKLSRLSLYTPPSKTIIRMGGGPRTYPGGVSKWQWKRMQAKKAKQLLKARLARERQIYEMRKRAELKASVSELERPWEVVEKAPNLFSVSADEQLKVLADRFQKPGGFDMWSERDGPQLFEAVDGLPSARFFPKGVVHSVKPYLRKEDEDGSENVGEESESQDGTSSESLMPENSARTSKVDRRTGKKNGVNWRRKGYRKRLDSAQVGFDRKKREQSSMIRGGSDRISRSNSQSSVYDMSLPQDGTYRFGERSD
ncbi:hypothetical protein SLEP1_g17864 [Rubroshorea leprosula]|uniref:DEAD-box ATP-dependent RNA helicase 33 n=1 Tax=Rubroshorea leprosula TaxID=152421 RepID=A0AAV5J4U8_9ROSI|nr:hypothetical protein SLEP1_g17864 [Rubroshorea leprosula]